MQHLCGLNVHCEGPLWGYSQVLLMGITNNPSKFSDWMGITNFINPSRLTDWMEITNNPSKFTGWMGITNNPSKLTGPIEIAFPEGVNGKISA